jgi:hypothetical protein
MAVTDGAVRCGARGRVRRPLPGLPGLPHPPGHLGAPVRRTPVITKEKHRIRCFSFTEGKTFAITAGHEAAGA